MKCWRRKILNRGYFSVKRRLTLHISKMRPLRQLYDILHHLPVTQAAAPMPNCIYLSFSLNSAEKAKSVVLMYQQPRIPIDPTLSHAPYYHLPRSMNAIVIFSHFCKYKSTEWLYKVMPPGSFLSRNETFHCYGIKKHYLMPINNHALSYCNNGISHYYVEIKLLIYYFLFWISFL